jgi:hypothetical protein
MGGPKLGMKLPSSRPRRSPPTGETRPELSRDLPPLIRFTRPIAGPGSRLSARRRHSPTPELRGIKRHLHASRAPPYADRTIVCRPLRKAFNAAFRDVTKPAPPSLRLATSTSEDLARRRTAQAEISGVEVGKFHQAGPVEKLDLRISEDDEPELP